MSDVTIVCVGDSANLQDLGILLHRGDKVTISSAQAQRSKDLRDAKGQGAVVVGAPKFQATRSYQEAQRVLAEVPTGRYAFVPPAPQPIEVSASQAPVVRPESAPTVAPSNRELQEILQALRALTAEVRALGQEIRTTSLPQRVEVVVAAPTEFIRQSSPPPPNPEPVFIPTNLVEKGDNRVAVTSKEGTDVGSLDAAAAVLKARRRKKS